MIKRTYLLITVGLLAGLFTLAASVINQTTSSDRLMGPFTVYSSTVDSTLDQNHAQFELNFSDYMLNRSKPLPEIELSCNGVIQRFQLDSTLKHTITVSPGKYQFMMTMSGGFQEIITDSVYIAPSHKTRVGIYFLKNPEPEEYKEPYHPRNRRRNDRVAYKPVLYFYSPKDLQVDVQLSPNGSFTYTYPAYENGWKGTVEAEGGITVNKKHYPYLFWEGNVNAVDALVDYSEGFVVSTENVTAFLEEKLSEMGLNDQEKTDFITFWGPRMAGSEKSHVQFLFNEAYDDIATLSITPKPDHTFRLYMLWTPLPESVTMNPAPQKLSTLKRDGFSVVEWGGSELTFTSNISFTH
ncbi:MAG: hypothetical protein V4604_05275 [Bacteroidota bacterium]